MKIDLSFPYCLPNSMEIIRSREKPIEKLSITNEFRWCLTNSTVKYTLQTFSLKPERLLPPNITYISLDSLLPPRNP